MLVPSIVNIVSLVKSILPILSSSKTSLGIEFICSNSSFVYLVINPLLHAIASSSLVKSFLCPVTSINDTS